MSRLYDYMTGQPVVYPPSTQLAAEFLANAHSELLRIITRIVAPYQAVFVLNTTTGPVVLQPCSVVTLWYRDLHVAHTMIGLFKWANRTFRPFPSLGGIGLLCGRERSVWSWTAGT